MKYKRKRRKGFLGRRKVKLQKRKNKRYSHYKVSRGGIRM